MSLAFENSQRRALYNVALRCCGTNHSRGAVGQQFRVDPSKQRMNMIITLAMEHSPVFKNYAGWLTDSR